MADVKGWRVSRSLVQSPMGCEYFTYQKSPINSSANGTFSSCKSKVEGKVVGSIPTLCVLTSSFFGYVLAQGEKHEKKGRWEGNSN